MLGPVQNMLRMFALRPKQICFYDRPILLYAPFHHFLLEYPPIQSELYSWVFTVQIGLKRSLSSGFSCSAVKELWSVCGWLKNSTEIKLNVLFVTFVGLTPSSTISGEGNSSKSGNSFGNSVDLALRCNSDGIHLRNGLSVFDCN